MAVDSAAFIDQIPDDAVLHAEALAAARDADTSVVVDVAVAAHFIEQAGTLFSRIKPRLAVFTHVVPSPATAEDLLPAARTTYGGPLAAGYDLMTIVVGDTVETFPRRTLSDQ